MAKQIEPMRKLLEKREHLKSLLAKMDGNDKLEELLEDVLKSSDSQDQLKNVLGLDQAGPDDSES